MTAPWDPEAPWRFAYFVRQTGKIFLFVGQDLEPPSTQRNYTRDFQTMGMD